MEDCRDAVKTIWTEFNNLSLFDHLCWHDQQWPDGLTIKSLNKGFGGTQQNMRQTKIADNEDNIGDHAMELTLYALNLVYHKIRQTKSNTICLIY